MDRLKRQLAPISDRAWEQIDEEAVRSLHRFLGGRALVDFSGPAGWEYSAASTGRVEPTDGPVPGVEFRRRRVTPVVEIRVPFTLDRSELDAVDRGSSSPDLDPVTDAARLAAQAEDRLIFTGGAGIEGMATSSPHEAIPLTTDYSEYPRHVAAAVARLRGAGIDGPYAIALGDRCYTGVVETTEDGGYPVFNHLRLILGGAVVWAPAIEGAVVLSTRGGDFEVTTGGDFAIGFSSADQERVELYLEESLTFRVHEPKAAVALRYA